MTKILLTGDKGFIGTHLKNKLILLGYNVYGFDIKEVEKYYDVRNEKSCQDRIKQVKPDIIIHLAALAGVRSSLKSPADYFETNITGTYYLLKWADKFGVKKFLFASSSSIYGQQGKIPLSEDIECFNPLSPYAVSKLAGEYLCRMFTNLKTIVFRPFTVYGENGRKDMVVGKLIRAGATGQVFEKYGDGNSVRGYTHIDDLVDGIVKLIDYEPKFNYEVFNLGGVEKVKLNDLIDIVKEVFPNLKVVQVDRNPADPLYSYASINKAKEVLGWEPQKKFKNEIKKLCLKAKMSKKY